MMRAGMNKDCDKVTASNLYFLFSRTAKAQRSSLESSESYRPSIINSCLTMSFASSTENVISSPVWSAISTNAS